MYINGFFFKVGKEDTCKKRTVVTSKKGTGTGDVIKKNVTLTSTLIFYKNQFLYHV